MHGCTRYWLGAALAAGLLWGACGTGRAEAGQPTDLAADWAYAAPADAASPQLNLPVPLFDPAVRFTSAEIFDPAEPPEGWTIKEVEVQTKPSHKFRGRIYADQIWMNDLDGPGAATFAENNFTGFDTVRIGVTGNIFENLKYTAEVEFEGNEVDFKDVYAQLTGLPWIGNFRIGHYKEPFGLEELTSSRFDTFMEQAAPSVMFVPTRNVGIMAYDYLLGNENVSWFVGFFRGGSHDDRVGRGKNDNDGGNLADGDSNDWAVTGRFVWLPYYDEATPGRCLVHLGLGATARRVGVDADQGGNGQLEGFLEMDSRDGPVNAFLPAFTEFSVLNTEIAWVRGPFNITNEFYFMGTNIGAQPWGTYLEASYFLTGENRGYDRGFKYFYRVHPYEPVFAVRTSEGVVRGRGAWQLAVRYSFLDLDEPTLAGTFGEQRNLAAGVNWYLNPYCRMMLNYVHSTSNVSPGQVPAAGDYDGDHLALRFQVDW